jgi:hypothetical protein
LKKASNPFKNFLQQIDSSGTVSDFIDELKLSMPEIHNVLKIYYEVFKTHTGSDSAESYFRLKNSMIKFSESLAKDDKYFVYVRLLESIDDTHIKEFNKSEETIDIIKLKIRDDLILNNDGMMGITGFISTVQTCANIGDHEFIEDFTKRFFDHLPEGNRENLKSFTEAHLLFAKGEFNRSLEKILTVEYSIPEMKYYQKCLQMMNYYELNEYESFFRHSIRISTFCQRISQYLRNGRCR